MLFKFRNNGRRSTAASNSKTLFILAEAVIALINKPGKTIITLDIIAFIAAYRYFTTNKVLPYFLCQTKSIIYFTVLIVVRNDFKRSFIANF